MACFFDQTKEYFALFCYSMHNLYPYCLLHILSGDYVCGRSCTVMQIVDIIFQIEPRVNMLLYRLL